MSKLPYIDLIKSNKTKTFRLLSNFILRRCLLSAHRWCGNLRRDLQFGGGATSEAEKSIYIIKIIESLNTNLHNSCLFYSIIFCFYLRSCLTPEPLPVVYGKPRVQDGLQLWRDWPGELFDNNLPDRKLPLLSDFIHVFIEEEWIVLKQRFFILLLEKRTC